MSVIEYAAARRPEKILVPDDLTALNRQLLAALQENPHHYFAKAEELAEQLPYVIPPHHPQREQLRLYAHFLPQAYAIASTIATPIDPAALYDGEILAQVVAATNGELQDTVQKHSSKRGKRAREAVERELFQDFFGRAAERARVFCAQVAAAQAMSNLTLRDIQTPSKGEKNLSDPVNMYLQEIGCTRLLTPEEEMHLAKLYAAGREALKLQSSDESLSQDRLWLLDLIERSGEEARNILLHANLRLVVTIAKRYRPRAKGRLSFLELINEGNLGLDRAIEKFDYTKGFKVSTYATWWIRQSVGKAIADKMRLIRVSTYTQEAIWRLRMAQGELAARLGRDPTPEETAAAMGMSAAAVLELEDADLEVVSLNLPVGQDEDAEMGDFIQSDQSSPEHTAISNVMPSDIKSALAGILDERAFQIIALRFGLFDGQPRTLKEMGEEFGVTRERIRQIEAKALAKLRKNPRLAALADYLRD